MYVTIRYKYDFSIKEDEFYKELAREENVSFDELLVNDYQYEEDFLSFENERELEAHIEDSKKYIWEVFEGAVTDVQIIPLSASEFLERREFELKHAICRRYADMLGIKFKTVREETCYCMDKDFLIKAYEFALDAFKDHSKGLFAEPDPIN